MSVSPYPLFDLTGRRALITGGGRGIGLALAKGLHAHGASVVLADREQSLLEQARKSFPASSRAATVSLDVTDEESVGETIDRLEKDHGPIDILVNNAGIVKRAPILETTAADFEAVMSVNVVGSFNVARAVARHMLPRGRGKIVNIASIMSEQARPTTAAYTASKGAVKLLTKTMCAEWAPSGLNVNAIGPGFVRTDMTLVTQQNAEFNDWLLAKVPMRRWGMPDDLVGACIFLAAPASDFVNGHVLTVDGGTISVL